ncbi:MAG: OsmC family protein [candidate division Zixibacteria bacterium]|nr:OsmC family protein [candidate division Zixibacteria bacterium]
MTTMKTMNRMLNGVDVTKLMEMMEQIRVQPELAAFKFRSRNRWIDGGHNRSTIKEFYGLSREDMTREKAFIMDNDEPATLLGSDRGANPVEYVLHALAGCLTTTLVYYAAAMGIKIDEIESMYEGDIDVQGLLGLSDKVRNGYQNIRVKFMIKSDAPKEKLEELILLAQGHSPVFDTLSRPVKVDVSLA